MCIYIHNYFKQSSISSDTEKQNAQQDHQGHARSYLRHLKSERNLNHMSKTSIHD